MQSSSGNTQFVDNPEYRAPELIEGADYDFSVDVYSLSVILYEFISEQKFVLKSKKTQASVLKAIRKQERPDMAELGENLGPVVALIKRGWSVEAKERPSLVEFETELKNL